MIGGILILILTGFLAFMVINRLKVKHPAIDKGLLKKLFFYHVLLGLAYYGYVLFNPSDSKAYYYWIVSDYYGEHWIDFYGTSTIFIEFLAYPFIKFFFFSYEAMMALFAFFGFLGFVFFYIFFKENIRFKHKFLGVDMITLIFFLPNVHFWSTSLGKGSVIFLGIGLFFYGISKMRTRLVPILLGSLIIYHVRPHIMLVILVSSAIAFVFSTKGISITLRVLFLAGALVAFFFIYQDVLKFVGIDEDQFITQGLDLTHRATELAKATSGVDITNYSLPVQVFTFLFRPLFFDAPGILGLIVSFENLLCLVLTLKVFSKISAWRLLLTGNFLIKSCFLSFITVSIALAQVSGNLGLAIRQKSQVMILFMFVIICVLDDEKFRKLKKLVQKKKRLDKLKTVGIVSQ